MLRSLKCCHYRQHQRQYGRQHQARSQQQGKPGRGCRRTYPNMPLWISTHRPVCRCPGWCPPPPPPPSLNNWGNVGAYGGAPFQRGRQRTGSSTQAPEGAPSLYNGAPPFYSRRNTGSYGAGPPFDHYTRHSMAGLHQDQQGYHHQAQ